MHQICLTSDGSNCVEKGVATFSELFMLGFGNCEPIYHNLIRIPFKTLPEDISRESEGIKWLRRTSIFYHGVKIESDSLCKRIGISEVILNRSFEPFGIPKKRSCLPSSKH